MMTPTRKRFRKALLGALILATLPFLARAQSNEGALAGIVLDSSGSVVPNVSVEAHNTATGQTFDTKSSSAGDYRFPSLAIGSYTVTATATGFSTSKQSDVFFNFNSTT